MSKTNKNNVTAMAQALTNALVECVNGGGNPGRVGRRILTNNAAHNNPNPGTVKPKKQQAADSAVGTQEVRQ